MPPLCDTPNNWYDASNGLHMGPEMDSNQSGAVGRTIWGPFQGSLTRLGTSGRLQSQIQAILGQILIFPDPPANSVKFLWS